MAKVSIYFRDESLGYESLNLVYDPTLYINSKQRRLIEVACNYDAFGNEFMRRSIDRFVLHESIREVKFDLTGQGKYYYVIKREEDK